MADPIWTKKRPWYWWDDESNQWLGYGARDRKSYGKVRGVGKIGTAFKRFSPESAKQLTRALEMEGKVLGEFGVGSVRAEIPKDHKLSQ